MNQMQGSSPFPEHPEFTISSCLHPHLCKLNLLWFTHFISWAWLSFLSCFKFISHVSDPQLDENPLTMSFQQLLEAWSLPLWHLHLPTRAIRRGSLVAFVKLDALLIYPRQDGSDASAPTKSNNHTNIHTQCQLSTSWRCVPFMIDSRLSASALLFLLFLPIAVTWWCGCRWWCSSPAANQSAW